jgi:hypothetical protein
MLETPPDSEDEMPMPQPDPEQVASISESEIKTDPIDAIDPSNHEFPMPTPQPSEPLDTIVEDQIETFSIIDREPSVFAVPIPVWPNAETHALMNESISQECPG